LKQGILALGVLAIAGTYILFLHPWSVRFESDPAGADVYVDEVSVGKTPLDGSVKFGKHLVRVELNGYEPESRTFKASESPIAFTLKARIAWTEIVTEPSGAEVVLGGRHLGRSPVSEVLIPNPPEKVVIQMKGYRSWEGMLGPANSLPVPIKLVRE
jgi:hypothetical protein